MQSSYNYPLFRRDKNPMSDETIKAIAPAVFATHPDEEAVSKKYSFIPTSTVLTGLREAGYEVFACGQHRTHNPQKEMFKRHILRLRPPGVAARQVGDVIPEVALMNAHDATTRYILYAGLLRLVCLNGMVVGDATIGNVKVIHTGGEETTENVLEESRKLIEKLPIILEQREAMLERQLTQREQTLFAETALRIRYGSGGARLTPAHLLGINREEDKGDDLWHVYNRIQENVTTKVHTIQGPNGRSRVGEVLQPQANTRINTRLWDAATELLAA